MIHVRLSDAIDEYLTSRSSNNLAANTVRMDKSILLRFLTHAGNIYCRSLEPHHVDSFFADSGCAASTRNMQLTRLRTFLRWCVRRNYMKSDPSVDRRRAAEANVDSRLFVPVERFGELLDAASHPRDRMLIATGLYLFTRSGEELGIRLDDIDLDEGEIVIHIQKTRDEHGRLDVDHMPITVELDRELRRWLSWYAENIDEPLAGDMCLLPSKKDYRSLPGINGKFEPTNATLVKIKPRKRMGRPEGPIQDALAKLGYPTLREGGHTLRRSGARALFDVLSEDGEDGALQEVKAMLHHKNVSMTERYLGIAPQRRKRNRRLKGKVMFPEPVPTLDSNVIEMRQPWQHALSQSVTETGKKRGSRPTSSSTRTDLSGRRTCVLTTPSLC